MSVGTALGQEYEAPTLAACCPGQDGAPHTGYASSQSSESGLKGRPASPDSPLLWAGGVYVPSVASEILLKTETCHLAAAVMCLSVFKPA